MTYIDEHGIKRDNSPEASAKFIATLNRGIDKIIRYTQLSAQAGAPVTLVYTEHRSTRGIKLISIKQPKG